MTAVLIGLNAYAQNANDGNRHVRTYVNRC